MTAPSSSNPQYKSFTATASQLGPNLSNFQADASQMSSFLPKPSLLTQNKLATLEELSCASNASSAIASTVVANTPALASGKRSLVVQLNDYPLPFSLLPYPAYSVQIKQGSSYEDLMRSISSTVGGQVDYRKGRVKASLPEVTLTASIYRDMATGRCFLEFDRNDGCSFRFLYLYYASLLHAASFLEIDVEDIKLKFQSAEKKLKVWEQFETKNQMESSSTSIDLNEKRDVII